MEKAERATMTRARAAALFALCGALYWGMRGASGYGGISGAVIPGLMWGLAWYLSAGPAARRIPWIVPACAIGFGLGGFNGYGQFTAWINGAFHVHYPEKWIYIDPGYGYLWMFLCGAGWGGLGGFFVSWALDRDKRGALPLARLLCLPAGAVAGSMLVARNPQIFAPLYTPELYDPAYCSDCARTLNTLPIIGAFIGMLVLPLAFDAARRNRRAVAIVLIAAVGFGIAFAGCSPFHLMHSIRPGFDWWKMWEMSLGAIGGASIALICFNYSPARAVAPQTDRRRGIIEFLSVDALIFLILNWALFNCLGVVCKYGDLPEHCSLKILLFAISLGVSGAVTIRSYTRTLTGAVRENLPRAAFLAAHTALSIMSFIVIFPNKRLLAIFAASSAAIFLIAALKEK